MLFYITINFLNEDMHLQCNFKYLGNIFLSEILFYYNFFLCFYYFQKRQYLSKY